MTKGKKQTTIAGAELEKCLTGISGVDTIMYGGLPKNRSTLVVGPTGSGKTLFGMQFLLYGALIDEPGLFISFEEQESDLIKNCSSLDLDLSKAVRKHKIILRSINIDRTDFDESGDYNLDGLFIQMAYNIDKYKIKRIVIDTIEVLFSHLSNQQIIRSELHRLLQWLTKKNVTAILTGEQGIESISRFGLEEYVADCVILLNNRITNELSTRLLRIIKFRGSPHGSNEYPFIIDKKGISLSPITAITMNYAVPNSFISSGVKALDELLNGNGYYQGGSVLINGVAGSGKTSLVTSFADNLCRSGKKCMYFAFEESADQIIRNMKSIGINLEQWVKKGRLLFHSVRPSVYGLESHLIKMVELIEDFKPDGVVIDPISNLRLIGSPLNVKLMLARLINYLKVKAITTIMTSLMHENIIEKEEGVSSLMDTWIQLKIVEFDLEQSTLLVIKKSRGMPHSKLMREFLLSHNGIDLADVYMGSGKIVVGSSRIVQAMQEEIEQVERSEEFNKKLRELDQQKNDIVNAINELNKKLQHLNENEQLLVDEQKKIKDITETGTKKISTIRTPSSRVVKKDGKNEE